MSFKFIHSKWSDHARSVVSPVIPYATIKENFVIIWIRMLPLSSKLIRAVYVFLSESQIFIKVIIQKVMNYFLSLSWPFLGFEILKRSLLGDPWIDVEVYKLGYFNDDGELSLHASRLESRRSNHMSRPNCEMIYLKKTWSQCYFLAHAKHIT